MLIVDGSKADTSNFVSEKYLQINNSGFQNFISDSVMIRKNGRQDYHILLLNSGRCEALHNGKLYSLEPGNLIIYEPGEEQKYAFKSESTSLWCHFTGGIVKELLDSCALSGGVFFLAPDKRIFDSFSNMIQRFHQPGMLRYANASLLELLYSISDAVTSSGQKEESRFLLPILAYINANYNKQINLDELAKKAGYSKSRFSHIFSEMTGISPMKYQNEIRLKISCEMLSSTELSIADVAYSCGFNDPLYYSRMFKKKFDMTPTEYRTSVSN